MRFATIKHDDIANAPGLSVSFYTQGCPHRCKGCFNPSTWDYNGGKEFTPVEMQDIINGLNKHNIPHSFCILGGEPLCPQNLEVTKYVIEKVKAVSPLTNIYIWSGYLYDELILRQDNETTYILSKIDYLIDGPYIQEQRDLSLKMRGSRNQRVIDMRKTRKSSKVILMEGT